MLVGKGMILLEVLKDHQKMGLEVKLFKKKKKS